MPKSATAADAETALSLLEQNPHIRVLFTDLRLGPGMDGAQLAHQALEMRPALKVLLTSGASGCEELAELERLTAVELLPRPYRRRDLVARLARML